ncbi:hypothetical protein ACQR1H_03040 [Bradyrhizobium sp. HKCCYLRH2015]
MSAPALAGWLIATRSAIILWVQVAVIPFEIAHDAIDAELRRQGIEP